MTAITYRFSYPDGRDWTYQVRFGGDGLPPSGPAPRWAALEFCRCPFCPLDAAEHTLCPAAAELAHLLDQALVRESYQEITLEVETPERLISRKTTLQKGLAALFGLAIGASGCPRTALFRPMARFHLPLATEEETLYRTVANYLLAQYFRNRDGGTPDWNLDGLIQHYRDMQVLNRHLALRLREAEANEAAVNAIVLLDLLAKAFPDDLTLALAELEPLFADVNS